MKCLIVNYKGSLIFEAKAGVNEVEIVWGQMNILRNQQQAARLWLEINPICIDIFQVVHSLETSVRLLLTHILNFTCLTKGIE